MLRAFVPVMLAASLVLGGCWKSETKAVLKADGSGTLKYDTGYKVESLEAVKARVEERMDQGGGGGGPGPEQFEEQLAAFTGRFEPAKVKSDLKAQGFEVKSAESYDKDGWKGVVVEASFSDINQVMSLIRAQRDAARQEAEGGGGGGGEEGGGRRRGGRGMGGMGRMGRNMDTTPVVPAAFKKTDDAAIGRMVITSPREAAAGRGAGGGRGGRGGRGGGAGGGMSDIPGADEVRRTLSLTLPGKIVETSNCRKEDDSTVVFELKAADMQPDEDGNFRSVVQDGAWVRFEIPAECKIKFEETAPAKSSEEKKAGEGEEDKNKPKKGGLKIGG